MLHLHEAGECQHVSYGTRRPAAPPPPGSDCCTMVLHHRAPWDCRMPVLPVPHSKACFCTFIVMVTVTVTALSYPCTLLHA